MVVLRGECFNSIHELLYETTTERQDISQLGLRHATDDDGHQICIGDWGASYLQIVRANLPDAALSDIRLTLKLIQHHLV